MRLARWLGLIVTMLAATGLHGLRAQEADAPPDDRPAFSLSSGEIFTTKATPSITLSFERLSSLDFRVYRVEDPVRFFEGLKEAHALGSPEYTAPTEQTWIERLASWKAARRGDMQRFLRRQTSREYRAQRRAQQDTAVVQRRVQLGLQSFAQVPLLNDKQIVTSWRELLPRLADTDTRRIPIEVIRPGLYVVEAVHGTQVASTLLMVSDVALVTKVAPGTLLAWTVDRHNGTPVSGCEVAGLIDRRPIGRGTTDARGLVALTLERAPQDDLVAVARCGDQVAASAPPTYELDAAPRTLVAHVFTDRPVYRPGHTVKAKAILRWRAGTALMPFDQRDVEVAIADRTGRVLVRERRPVDEFGGVDTALALPAGAALGIYSIEIASGEQKASGAFEVQEYRKPEFEVSVTPSTRIARQGRTLDVTVEARYYFGQPVRDANVQLVVQTATYYSPLRWVDSAGEDEVGGGGYFYGGNEGETLTARLDAQGRARLRVTLPVSETASDLQVRLEARVTDASDFEVTSHALVVGSYGDFLLAARATPSVAKPGAPVTVRVRAVDYRGTAVAGVPVTVDFIHVDWNAPSGREREVLVTSQVTTGPDGRATLNANVPDRTGSYTIEARATSGDRQVTGSSYVWAPGATDETYEQTSESIELVADKSTYAPGEVARVAIRGTAPSVPVLLSKEARTLTWYDLRQPTPDGVFDVPVSDVDLGDTWVHVLYLKDDKVYYAEKKLRVPPVTRALTVEVRADKSVYRPGEPGVYAIRTLDADGRPVRAQVALGVVDEAVYGVRPDSTDDPLRVFYRTEYSRVATDYSRYYAFTGYSGTLRMQLAQRRRPLSLADFKGDTPTRPRVRKDFPDTIYWSPAVVTAADGTATVRVEYPDSLTTWRLTARAITTDTKAGLGLARTVTTRDLILRVVPPRFLTERDEVSIPAIVHNYQAGEPAPVSVTVSATGLEAPLSAARTVAVASGDEVRTDWPFTAGAPGTATIRGTATMSNNSDAMEVSLPVLPFGAKRDVGVSGVLAAGASRTLTLDVPASSNPAARQIGVSVMPSMSGSLLGALDDLVQFPYGCTEQTVSSFVPNLLVMRTLEQLGIAPTERMSMLDKVSRTGLERLVGLQHDSGAWGWWKTDDEHPFMTAYAVYGLVEAKAAGLQVPYTAITGGSNALARQLVETPRLVPELKAYALYVLARALAADVYVRADGFDHARELDALWQRRGDLTPYGQAWLLLALRVGKDDRTGELASTLSARAQTRGDLAWWPSESDPLLGDWGDATADATAAVVQALASVRPDDPVVDAGVRWLLANRTSGYSWNSTKQTAGVLYGLLEVMRARQEQAGPVTVTVSAGGQSQSVAFTAADWTRPFPAVVTLPATVGENTVTITTTGGTAYWTASARYYDTAEGLERSGSRKLALSRQYFRLAPTTRNGRVVYEEQPYTGTARPGDLLLVRLVVAGANDWRYLMVEDPIPAGTEAVTTPNRLELARPPDWTFGSHREYRDDRVAIFLDAFDGRAEFAYLLRVTTPGQFRAMPAQVTPMYVPGIHASSLVQSLTVPVPTGAQP